MQCERNGMDIKRILLMIFTFGLGAVLLVFVFMDISNDKARNKARQDAEVEARQYEIQIQDLEVEILEREKTVAVEPDHGRAVIGFHLSGVEDVEFTLSMGETYGFKPTVVLDCTKSEEDLMAIVEALQAAGHPADVMLTGTPFDDVVLAHARMLLSELPAHDFARGISFLLRSADDSEKNRSVILDEAFSGYAFYNDSGAAGTLPSGTPYISYSFMHSEDINADKLLKTIGSGKTSMIIVMDLASVAQGTLNRETVVNWIEKTVEQQNQGNLEICGVDDAYGALRKLLAEYNAAKEDYESFKAEKESEIAALKEKIAEIKS